MAAKAGRWAGWLCAGLLCFATGCAGPIRVETERDPAADLAALRAFSWFPEPRRRGDPGPEDAQLDARIRRAVEAELSIRGYRRAVGLEPDFLVTYHVALDRRLDAAALRRYYGPAWRTGASAREYEEGSLLLDFLDPRSRQLLWRGSAQAGLSRGAAPGEHDPRIREAVRRMLERLPPLAPPGS